MAGDSSAAVTGGGAYGRARCGGYGNQTKRERGGNSGGAHRGCDGGLGELGEASATANLRRRSSGTGMRETAWAAMQGFRRAVDRWGGRGGRGGAPGHISEARGGRWPRGSSSVAAAPFGPGEREGTEERGDAAGEEEERGDTRPRRGVAREAGGKAGGGREAGGGRGAWPRAPGACPSSWQGGRRQGREAAVGWASGRSWAGWAG